MPRNTAGEFYLTPGTAAVRDQIAHSAHVNQRFADLLFDANFPRPVLVGGTGASTAAGARDNLGVPETSTVALLAAGNTFKTTQDIDTTSDVKLRMRGSATSIIEAYSAVSGQRVGVMLFDNLANLFRIYLDASGGNPSVRLELGRDGTLKLNGQALYHPGNKPSASDVGALPAAGKAADADKLDGLDSTQFLRSDGKAVDADKLDGYDSAAFIRHSQAQDVAEVGATAFLRSTGAVSIGLTYAGSTLTAAGLTSAGALHVGATAMAGQWRALGACPAGGATMFIKIS